MEGKGKGGVPYARSAAISMASVAARSVLEALWKGGGDDGGFVVFSGSISG